VTGGGDFSAALRLAGIRHAAIAAIAAWTTVREDMQNSSVHAGRIIRPVERKEPRNGAR
jgi:hypothetical protein